MENIVGHLNAGHQQVIHLIFKSHLFYIIKLFIQLCLRIMYSILCCTFIE